MEPESGSGTLLKYHMKYITFKQQLELDYRQLIDLPNQIMVCS